jgi:hypothetical protein
MGDQVGKQPGSLHTDEDGCPQARLDDHRLALEVLYHKAEEKESAGRDNIPIGGAHSLHRVASDGHLVDPEGQVGI